MIRWVLRGLPQVARGPRWMLVLVLSASLFDEGASFLPSGALESFRADLGLSYTRAGTVLSVMAFGAIAGSALSVAIDVIGSRLVAAGGAGLGALSMGAFALTPWYWGMLVASALYGVAATMLMDGTSVALSVTVGESSLRPYLARANFFGVVGDFAGPLLLGALLGVGASWRAAFGLAAVALALYGVLLAAAPLPGAVVEEGDCSGAARPLRILREVMADPAVWIIGGLSLVLAPFDEPLLGFVLALAESRGLGAGARTVIALALVGGGLLTYTVIEVRVRAVGDAATLAAGGAYLGVGALLVAGLANPAGMTVGGALAGAGLALTWLALEHRQLTLRPGQEGTTRAVVGGLEAVGFLLPALIGALADAFGLAVGVAGYGALSVIVIVGASALRRRIGESAGEA